jgi:hypothetical protein
VGDTSFIDQISVSIYKLSIHATLTWTDFAFDIEIDIFISNFVLNNDFAKDAVFEQSALLAFIYK